VAFVAQEVRLTDENQIPILYPVLQERLHFDGERFAITDERDRFLFRAGEKLAYLADPRTLDRLRRDIEPYLNRTDLKAGPLPHPGEHSWFYLQADGCGGVQPLLRLENARGRELLLHLPLPWLTVMCPVFRRGLEKAGTNPGYKFTLTSDRARGFRELPGDFFSND
jgi:hypothetical protein